MPSIFLLFFASPSSAQNYWNEKKGFTVEFGNINTWPAIIDLTTTEKKLYVFDESIYPGHPNFVLRYLKRKVNFHTFKDQVKYPESRSYITFYLYDLRDKNFALDGKKINWGIKISDYILTDNESQILNLIEFTYTKLATYLHHLDSSAGEGVFLLSNSENATPNFRLLKKISEKNIPTCDCRTLYAGINYQPAATQILNEGTATGYLRYIPKNFENEVNNDENAIYVFEQTPERVPLAAAIITLQPQTMLSHINLLAINRKTPNLSTADPDLIRQIKNYRDSLVSIHCEKKPMIFCELNTVDSIPEKISKRLKEKVNLAPADLSIKNIVSLIDSLRNKTEQVGSKASNYAVLQKRFPKYVKKAYAIPFYGFHSVISTKKVDSLITRYSEIPSENRKDKKNLQEEIRTAILNAKLPESIISQIIDLQKNVFKNKKMRIRSSTNCEDLPGFNGAGLYLSKAIKPFEQPAGIEKKLLMVYASLWNTNACSEREFFGIDHREASMAILCNEAFENEWANGVALVLPDAESEKLSLVIDVQPGEHEVTNPAPGDVPEELYFPNVNDKNFSITSRSKYGKVLQGLTFTKNTAEEIRILALQIDRILKKDITADKKNNFGTDIEFKIMNESGKAKLWVKQARLLQVKNNQ